MFWLVVFFNLFFLIMVCIDVVIGMSVFFDAN